MKTKLIIIITILVLLFTGCSNNTTVTENKNQETVIATTFFPLYEITKEITGNDFKIVSVIPTDVEPHEYELSIKEIKNFEKADLFVTLGVGFVNVENKLISSRNNINIIDSAKGLSFIDIQNENNNFFNDETGVDPHIWVSPKNMKKIATNIYNGLVSRYPNNKDEFEYNYNQLIANLNLLDEDYSQELSNCSKNVILATHDAYYYLGRDYGFQVYSISGIEPESEPNPQQIAKIVKIAKENNIKYVFYEDFVSPQVAKTIASEVGAEVLILNPAEGGDDGDTYVSIMQSNLNNLKLALQCS